MNKNLIPNSKQILASNPNVNVWVSASAGTGKTKILVDRVLRLLLNGESIENILCITYTKTASQEMINRLMDILANWSILKPEQLQRKLYALTNEPPSSEQIILAETLFSKLLNNMEKIQIQTIHSFCQKILSQFPLEANLPTNFYVIEDSLAKNLKKQAIYYILNLKFNNLSNEDNESKSLLTKIITNMSGFTFESQMEDMLTNSYELEHIIEFYNLNASWDKYEDSLYKYLNANKNIKSNSLKESLLNNPETIESLKKITLELNSKESNPTAFNNDFLLFLNKSLPERILQFNYYQQIFLTEKLTPRKIIVSKKYLQGFSQETQDFINNTISKATNDLVNFQQSYNNQLTAEINLAFMKISIEIYNTYQYLKEESSLVDFNDLIIKTHKLLSKSTMKDWILYKLDSKINHILVDEAQDTSFLQWEIIKHFSEDFFSGLSAKENKRTIFIVGDIKQSIYSFQGADPYIFNTINSYFKNKILSSNCAWHQIPLNLSFRSNKGIINTINSFIPNLFDNTKAPYLKEEFTHTSNSKENDPYNVEIWPSISQNKDSTNKYERYKNLAQAITKKIQNLHFEHNIDYSDILILYKKRQNNKTLTYLIKLFKNNNIPILGLDKINLNDSIAILDLLSLTKFLLQHNDDFSLCCVLKSPLFNLSDNDIVNLKTLSNTLKVNIFESLESSSFKHIYQELKSLIEDSKILGVFELFFKILYTNNGVKKFVSRLGQEVIEALSEFMNLILNQFLPNNTNTLQVFLKYLLEHTQDISRDSSDNTNSVKLMTIHGAKGLESKVVFLLQDLDDKTSYTSLIHNNSPTSPLLLLTLSSQNRANILNELLENLQIKQQDELKRLFYVAISRAKEHLYICSVCKQLPTDTKPNQVWYNCINNTLISNQHCFIEEESSFFTEDLNFISKTYYKTTQIKSSTKDSSQSLVNTNSPSWYEETPIAESSLSKPISPSKIEIDEKYFISPLDMLSKQINPKINKGLVIHKILEQLNYVSNNHLEYAKKFLDNLYAKLSLEDKNQILHDIQNILTHPNLDFLFTHPSLNEVFISGMIQHNNEMQIISARVDKIIKLQNNIIIIDYKFAKSKAIMPKNYITQMTLYKKILKQIYPHHIVKSYILFTQDISLVEIQ